MLANFSKELLGTRNSWDEAQAYLPSNDCDEMLANFSSSQELLDRNTEMSSSIPSDDMLAIFSQ